MQNDPSLGKRKAEERESRREETSHHIPGGKGDQALRGQYQMASQN